MRATPKSLRLQIGLFGRTNVGKSSFLNMVAGQDVAITSPVPGTTTDVVEKTMELLPIGPVVFLDTAGIDDISELSDLRIERSRKMFSRSDVICLLLESGKWGEYEEGIVSEASAGGVPVVAIVNKEDILPPEDSFFGEVKGKVAEVMTASSVTGAKRDEYITELKRCLINVCPEDFLKPPPLVGDLLPSGGTAMLIVPIDIQAPKGRLILPQVQTIRDALDNDASITVVKEREYSAALENFKRPPDLVVCDSQVVLKMVADTPPGIKCTTFSILFSRYKGELVEAVKGVTAIEKIGPGSRVLIAEACSHHAMEDDIGRVKIPRWIRQYIGADIDVDVYAGRDYPADLADYDLVVHCGACMITRREMLFRMHLARQAGVPITNYGVCISFVQGVLERVLSPFPAGLDAYHRRNV